MSREDIWEELLSQPLWVGYAVSGRTFEDVKFCPTHGIFWEGAIPRWPNGDLAAICGDMNWTECLEQSNLDLPLLVSINHYSEDALAELLRVVKTRPWEELEASNEQ